MNKLQQARMSTEEIFKAPKSVRSKDRMSHNYSL